MWLYSRYGEDPSCQGPNAGPEVLGAGVRQQHFSAAAAGASSTSCTHAGGWEASSRGPADQRSADPADLRLDGGPDLAGYI